MTKYEKEEIKDLPEKYRPLTAWGYFGYSILFSLPLIGFILVVVFSCINDNINRRSYARRYLLADLIGTVIGLAILAVIIIVVLPYIPSDTASLFGLRII